MSAVKLSQKQTRMMKRLLPQNYRLQVDIHVVAQAILSFVVEFLKWVSVAGVVGERTHITLELLQPVSCILEVCQFNGSV